MVAAPIVLFVYNRPWHTQQTVESLQQNPLAAQSDLYIFSDGPKTHADAENVNAVRQYIRQITGFQNVFIQERSTNLGLSHSVIQGISDVIQERGCVIAMEDDMVCATNFLNFMNDALRTYQTTSTIFSVSGYSYPVTIPSEYPHDVYVLPRASSWGWGTWRDRWQRTDWDVRDYVQFIQNPKEIKAFTQGGNDLLYMLIKQQKGRINSWAIRWTYAHYKNQAYCLHLVKPKIRNIGADSSGTHTPKTNRYDSLISEDGYTLPENIQVDERLVQNLRRFFRSSLIRRTINYLTLR